MMIYIIASVLTVLTLTGLVFANQPNFGRLPRGERLERVKRSPQYRDGKFHNQHPTALMTSGKGRLRSMGEFLFSKKDRLYPEEPIPAVRTDLKTLSPDEDWMVWFGHSSYLLQLNGKRILVDPVFYSASPVSFINRPFAGTALYRPDDMPDIDYLVISHDHWDHLDYKTVKALKNRIRKVVCPLGVGEHFEYWGFDKNRLVELDWQEEAALDPGFTIHCLPARHFSGRGWTSDQTLWASFLIETPRRKVYMGGDGGYDTHFAEIGKQYGKIDLAVLENGQYNEDWRYIHIMPLYLGRAARDLKAEAVVTVHHSKYALSKHSWDEPLKNEVWAAREYGLNLVVPVIGEAVGLDALDTRDSVAVVES